MKEKEIEDENEDDDFMRKLLSTDNNFEVLPFTCKVSMKWDFEYKQ